MHDHFPSLKSLFLTLRPHEKILTNWRAQRGNFLNTYINFARFLKKFLTNGRAQRGNFFEYIIDFYDFFLRNSIAPRFKKTFGRDAFYYSKTALFCKITPHKKIRP